jgi:hypothetical protein
MTAELRLAWRPIGQFDAELGTTATERFTVKFAAVVKMQTAWKTGHRPVDNLAQAFEPCCFCIDDARD